VVSLPQLKALGMGERAVQKRATAGRLHRIHRGVYAVGRAHLDARGRRMGAVLAGGPGAAISHRTSADEIGFLRTASARVEVTVTGRGGRNRDGITFHRSPTLRPEDCAIVTGIPCTNTARTLLDLADVVSAARLAQAIEGAERLRVLDARAIEAVLGRATGREAATRLRDALVAYTGKPPPPTRRELERRAFEVFRGAGLPRPDVNVLVETAQGPYEVDFCWPDRRLIVEADSFEFHRSRRAFEADRRRDQLMRARGWTTVRITWRQLNERPTEVIAAVA
jgi:uncharacterized protein DUF559/putative AbiEi antitoxin of type IV toxin-antitoxin system